MASDTRSRMVKSYGVYCVKPKTILDLEQAISQINAEKCQIFFFRSFANSVLLNMKRNILNMLNGLLIITKKSVTFRRDVMINKLV